MLLNKHPCMSWLPPVLGAVGVWATFTAFGDVLAAGESFPTHRDSGLWVAIGGYLLASIGATAMQARTAVPALTQPSMA